jgi:TetR/AcrR family transcriptional regulator, transcriptional repressor for nem operon
MGHSRAEKTETHKRIVRIASKRMREEGLKGVGIAELMKEAGLTVGGFYKHFRSRDELVGEAVQSAFGGMKRRLDDDLKSGRAPSYGKLVDDYLTEAHRDHPGTGCAFSALTAEIARGDKRTREIASEQIGKNFQLIGSLLPGKDRRAARSKAILTFSALVGAMSLSRAVSDEKLSREILESVAEELNGTQNWRRKSNFARPGRPG